MPTCRRLLDSVCKVKGKSISTEGRAETHFRVTLSRG